MPTGGIRKIYLMFSFGCLLDSEKSSATNLPATNFSETNFPATNFPETNFPSD